MAEQVINNTDENPDTVKMAFQKTKENFAELYDLIEELINTRTGTGIASIAGSFVLFEKPIGEPNPLPSTNYVVFTDSAGVWIPDDEKQVNGFMAFATEDGVIFKFESKVVI